MFSATLFPAAPNAVRAFSEGRQSTEADAAQLESSLATDPEDVETRARLAGFYAIPGKDREWSNRLRLLSWAVEHHPDSDFLSVPNLWLGVPEPMFQMLKSQWIPQVHQHADDPAVLRNASAFLSRTSVPNAIRVGGNVAAVNLLTKVDPVYPPLAMQARVQGTVKMNVTIDEEGHIVNSTLVSGHPLLVQAAMQALQQWIYKPTLLNGKPVQVSTTVDIDFVLRQ